MKYFKPLKVLQAHSTSVRNVKFSKDGSQIVVSSVDGTTRIWDVKSGTLKLCIEKAADDQLSLDKEIITIDTLDKLRDSEPGKEITKLTGHIDLTDDVTFSSDGRSAVFYSMDNTIRIWNVTFDKELTLLQGHSNVVTDAKFSPDSQTLVSCSDDSTIRLWDVKAKTELQTLYGHSGPVIQVDISADGNTIVSCANDKTIRLWGRW
ncbi:G-protein beta WD-40 repeats containing protein [Reticulomyxa filosa]|uniref:G-protein beta WD-40 repeats containing protein n=1 Tax=Reticulomyxa filosa TaxID=46433 RepID=X6N2Y6_RETFI|nr:G-protein beta WD-40 repeats containing protein [Reticulomyxa filosa]|eukprot:ETO20411.1 G-protein beta WD-40 repeats containing protein [Reticulomyxa filosa]